jgi:hypothetical protein
MTRTTNLGASAPWPEGGKSLRIPVKRTSNGGAGLFAPPKAVAPLAAAYVKRAPIPHMRTRLLAYCAVVLGFSVPLSTTACECIERPVDEHYAAADLVFAARVVETKETLIKGLPIGLAGRFTVLRSVKGDAESIASVVTIGRRDNRGGGSCGIGLTVGKTYIFFADAKGQTNACNGTQVYFSGNERYEQTLRRLEQLRSGVR